MEYLAPDPGAGISLGSGLRKLRIVRDGAGKSSGYRNKSCDDRARFLPLVMRRRFGRLGAGRTSARPAVARYVAVRGCVGAGEGAGARGKPSLSGSLRKSV